MGDDPYRSKPKEFTPSAEPPKRLARSKRERELSPFETSVVRAIESWLEREDDIVLPLIEIEKEFRAQLISRTELFKLVAQSTSFRIETRRGPVLIRAKHEQWCFCDECASNRMNRWIWAARDEHPRHRPRIE